MHEEVARNSRTVVSGGGCDADLVGLICSQSAAKCLSPLLSSDWPLRR